MMVDYADIGIPEPIPSTYYEVVALKDGKSQGYDDFQSLSMWLPLATDETEDGYGLLEPILEVNGIEAGVATTPDLINKIKDVFGLNPTQLSKIVDVSRATIYNHMKLETGTGSVETYQGLYKLALTVEAKHGNISNGLKSVLVNGKSLLKHLQRKDLDNEYLLAVIDQVVEKMPVKQKNQLSYLEQRKANISSSLG